MINKVRSLLNWYSKLSPKKLPLPPYGHIVQLGDPILRNSAELVPIDLIKSNEILKTIKKLEAVMNDYSSCGISAPQIGVNKRIIAIQFREYHKSLNEDLCEAQEMSFLPFTVVINPSIKILSHKKVTFFESCESIRGYSAQVPRYHQILLSGFNPNAEEIKISLKGWSARIAQHEIDHLDGKLFIDTMVHNTFHCTCWKEVNEYHGKITLPFYPA